MYNHEPKDYKCPLCLIVNGEDNPGIFAKVADIFYKDDFITAFIGGKFWPNNKGGVIIIPNKHTENLYDIDEETGHKVFDFSKVLAIALKEVYKCDGVSTRQHNEPAGNQDVWHYHVHVTPRYENDRLYQNQDNKYWSTPEERKPYAEKLKRYFANL